MSQILLSEWKSTFLLLEDIHYPALHTNKTLETILSNSLQNSRCS